MRIAPALLACLVASTALAQSPAPCPDIPFGTNPIDSVELQGLKTTHAAVVLRELLNAPGSAFSCDEWNREKTRLEDLDVFAEVHLKADTAGGRRTLVYSFRELPPYLPFVAMSKTDQDGISIGPALASLNLFGWDIRSEFIARFGGTTEFQASVSSPWIGSWPIEYDLAALRIDSYNDIDIIHFHEDSWRFKLDLAQRVWESAQRGAAGDGGASRGGVFTGGIAHILYAGELFMLEDGRRAGDSGSVLLSGRRDIVPRLGTGFLWDGRDRRHDPSRGWYQELRLTQNGGFLGGPADFTEWLADTRVYLPWLPRHTLLAAGLYQYRTGALGQSFGRYDLYHVGGVNTLRGYGTDAYRGKSEVILTLEDRMDWIRKRTFRLWGWGGYYGVQGILGVEAASLWDHDAVLEGDLHPGVYAGVHLLIAGVDRIRLEIGSKTAKLAFRYDVGILEKADIQRFRSR